jgi:predicted ferric reductase
VVPFERMTSFHIFVGYCFCIVMVLSVVGFFTFFGKVCHEHKAGLDPADLCEKFTSEIMITGYCIFASTLIVMFSSYFRDKIPYEIFYGLHHFVFAMFFLALLHTLDDEFRKGTTVGKARSQVFRWFTASLVIYFTDRAWSLFSAYRCVPLKYVENTKDGAVLVLCLKKPPGFDFTAGQYAFLQLPAIDFTWHPFSIASPSRSEELRFIIEVMKPKSWTHKLAKLISEVAVDAIRVNVIGGFGASVTDGQVYNEILAIGTTTGIVPMISLMTDRVNRLRLLSKDVGFEALKPARSQGEGQQHAQRDMDERGRKRGLERSQSSNEMENDQQ